MAHLTSRTAYADLVERLSTRAYELGLLNRIVPAGDALEGALALARSIVANGPLAVATSQGGRRGTRSTQCCGSRPRGDQLAGCARVA